IAAPAAKTAMGQLFGVAGSRRAWLPSTPIFKDGGVAGGPSFVAVMQPADLGQRHDRSHFWRLNPSRLGRVFPQGEMGSRSVIVIQVGSEDATERALREHEHMVQECPPNGSNQCLATGS